MIPPRPLLAFRPVSVVHRLPPRSEACLLSLRDLLRALRGARRPLPIFAAPGRPVLRAVLLAAKEAGAAVGLRLPPGQAPGPWFEAVARTADELAPRLPIFLSGEVAVEPGGHGAEQAAHRAWGLVDAGLTHLGIDVSAVPGAERARVASQVAAYAAEREIAVDVLFPAGGGALPAPEEASAFLEELDGWGLLPDVLGLRCPAPEGAEALREQARGLGAVAAALGRTPLLRRGPATPVLLQVLRAVGVAAADDEGQVVTAGLRALPVEARAGWAEAQERELRHGGPPGPVEERLEALAFGEALAVIEALGAAGSAAAVGSALSRAESA